MPAPILTCVVEDLTGLTTGTLNPKILIGQPVEYYWEFSAEDVFTADSTSPDTKGSIRAVWTKLKNFNTGKTVNAREVLDGAANGKPLYFYVEDRDNNPTSQLYDTVYFEGPKAGEKSITNVLQSNFNPNKGPITIQFESNGYEGPSEIYSKAIW